MAGLAESTVCKIATEVCNAIIENLWTDTVDKHFSKSVDDFRNKLQEMECEWQHKYAFAAIDGSHYPIKGPSGGMHIIASSGLVSEHLEIRSIRPIKLRRVNQFLAKFKQLLILKFHLKFLVMVLSH